MNQGKHISKKLFTICLLHPFLLFAEEPVSIAGVYPSLTMYNDEGECGPGAVVPAGRPQVA